jgi:hypothetical protein
MNNLRDFLALIFAILAFLAALCMIALDAISAKLSKR